MQRHLGLLRPVRAFPQPKVTVIVFFAKKTFEKKREIKKEKT